MTKTNSSNGGKTKTASSKTTKPPKKVGSKKISGGGSAQMRILVAIAQKKAFGEETPRRKDICSMSGLTSNDSFRVTCSNMKKKGLIEHPDKVTVKLTPMGEETVGPELSKAPKTNDAVHASIKEQLPGGKPQLIFNCLLDGRARSKLEIARAIGYDDEKSDSVRVFISKLSKYTDRVDGKIRLKDSVFPFGRPTINNE